MDDSLRFIFGVTSALAFVASFRCMRHARLMEDTPRSRVRSAHQGYVELEGVAHPVGELLKSPLTKTSCVWWSYSIEQRTGSGEGARWETLVRESSEAPFWLDDSTGRCQLLPADAGVVADVSHCWHGDTERPVGGPRDEDGSGQHGFRYSEQLLRPGTKICALGQFRTLYPSPNPGGEEASVSERLARWEKDPQRRQRLDFNQDGKLDAEEWELARSLARAEWREEELRTISNGINTLIVPESPHQPFLVSAVLQSQLCERFRQAAKFSFAWFLIGGLIFLFA